MFFMSIAKKTYDYEMERVGVNSSRRKKTPHPNALGCGALYLDCVRLLFN